MHHNLILLREFIGKIKYVDALIKLQIVVCLPILYAYIGICIDSGKYFHIHSWYGWRFAALLKVVYWRKWYEKPEAS